VKKAAAAAAAAAGAAAGHTKQLLTLGPAAMHKHLLYMRPYPHEQAYFEQVCLRAPGAPLRLQPVAHPRNHTHSGRGGAGGGGAGGVEGGVTTAAQRPCTARDILLPPLSCRAPQLESLDLVNCIIAPMFFANALSIWHWTGLSLVYCVVLLIKGYQLGLLLLPGARRKHKYRRARCVCVGAEVEVSLLRFPDGQAGWRAASWCRRLWPTNQSVLLLSSLLVWCVLQVLPDSRRARAAPVCRHASAGQESSLHWVDAPAASHLLAAAAHHEDPCVSFCARAGTSADGACRVLQAVQDQHSAGQASASCTWHGADTVATHLLPCRLISGVTISFWNGERGRSPVRPRTRVLCPEDTTPRQQPVADTCHLSLLCAVCCAVLRCPLHTQPSASPWTLCPRSW
jgi:hypothetical protein